MNTAEHRSRWRLVRYTPMRDIVRGRVTGRLDVQRIIDDSELPESIRAVVRNVVRRTRLWRLEKADVAQELVAHFRDGMGSGAEADELIRDFGDPRQTARLIRRAKKRNRPWAWHVARGGVWVLAACVGVYLAATLLLLLAKPDVSVDYLAQLNADARAVPEEDRAWPLYRKALLAGLRDLDIRTLQVKTGEFQGRDIHRLIRAGEPGWEEAKAFRRDQSEVLTLIRAAAAKPGMGLQAGFARDLDDQDIEALYPPEGRQSLAKYHPGQPASEPLIGVLVPPLSYMRKAARLLSVDTEAAVEEHDRHRAMANWRAMFGLARHARETPIVISSLVASNITNLAVQQMADVLDHDPKQWSREELTELAHLLARVDPLVQMRLEGERMSMYDMFQRIYSEDGYVTREGLRFIEALDANYWTKYGRNLSELELMFRLPLVNTIMASRGDMEAQYERLMAMAEGEAAKYLWERQRPSPMEVEVEKMMMTFKTRWRYEPLLMMMPALSASYDARDRAIAMRDALLVAIAMELYRRDHDGYPDDLATLSPRYLPAPPIDYSSGGPLRVAYAEDGSFVLYGLGRDGDDDGGTLSDQGRSIWPHIPEADEGGDWVLYPPVIAPAMESQDEGVE